MNKKLIVVGVVGLVVGLSGATGIVFTREKQARAAAQALLTDSLAAHADSAGVAHGAVPDSAAAAAAHTASADSSVAGSLAGDHPVSGDSATLAHGPQPLHPGAPGAPPADSAHAAPQATVPSALKPQQLARMFAEMKPTQAAKVLEKMDDGEIQKILGQLREKQAAAILSSLPPQRAADISRSVIRSHRSSL